MGAMASAGAVGSVGCIIHLRMSLPLLSTKFYIPPARENAIARPRLTDKLMAGMNQPGSFTLLSGPAGFGKTTLLSEFVARLQLPVAWVSLDEGDNDPVRFWSYLIAACQMENAGVGASAQAILQSPQPLPTDTIPTILINDLASLDHELVLILDNFHAIQDETIHSAFLFLLEHLPGNLHILVSTRTDPPWPLARFRVRNQLVEIRAQDLRFNVEEAAEFLNRTMGLTLSADDVAALDARTEGWIAGL
jgi:LuxR family maltose regulon positive regulatory protein